MRFTSGMPGGGCSWCLTMQESLHRSFEPDNFLGSLNRDVKVVEVSQLRDALNQIQ